MEMRVNQIELKGLTFQYREAGEASAPAIIALHALGMSAESWDEVAAVLGKEYWF
ncbi:alpha/beta hydrolase, partial [Priestia megaterium]